MFWSFLFLESRVEERLPNTYKEREFEMNETMLMMTMINPTNVSGKQQVLNRNWMRWLRYQTKTQCK